MRELMRAFCASAGAIAFATPAMADISDRQSFKVLGAVVVWGADDATAGAGVPVASDFIIDTGTGNRSFNSGDHDLIAGDVHTVMTGTLNPVVDGVGSIANSGSGMFVRRIPGSANFTADTDADGVLDTGDGFGAFSLDNSTDTGAMFVRSSFYVASNTAFNIDAQAAPIGTTSAADMFNMRMRMRVDRTGNDGLAYGSRAQFPHSAGNNGGIAANNRRLSNLTTSRRVFQGNQRTAVLPGTIAQQSVRFDVRYIYRTLNYDLSYGTPEAEAEVTFTVYMP